MTWWHTPEIQGVNHAGYVALGHLKALGFREYGPYGELCAPQASENQWFDFSQTVSHPCFPEDASRRLYMRRSKQVKTEPTSPNLPLQTSASSGEEFVHPVAHNADAAPHDQGLHSTGKFGQPAPPAKSEPHATAPDVSPDANLPKALPGAAPADVLPAPTQPTAPPPEEHICVLCQCSLEPQLSGLSGHWLPCSHVEHTECHAEALQISGHTDATYECPLCRMTPTQCTAKEISQ